MKNPLKKLRQRKNDSLLKKSPEDQILDFMKVIGKSLGDDLRNEIPDILKDIVDIRFKGLKDGLDVLKEINARLLDQANDIENLQASFKKLEVDLEAIRRKNQKLPEETKEAAAKGALKAVEKKMEEKKGEMIDTIRDELDRIPAKPTRSKRKKWWEYLILWG